LFIFIKFLRIFLTKYLKQRLKPEKIPMVRVVCINIANFLRGGAIPYTASIFRFQEAFELFYLLRIYAKSGGYLVIDELARRVPFDLTFNNILDALVGQLCGKHKHSAVAPHGGLEHFVSEIFLLNNVRVFHHSRSILAHNLSAPHRLRTCVHGLTSTPKIVKITT
jgi:hypothetical protein